ncbi:hypothetical protein CCH79_00009183 [Gambusia affinis]|uniref:Uncharacterized protein n=1 Tax=Gambusia affinis TaxID=33528 RepID=A0A315W3V4_GAMAF|nr:hypothetical protein CCH79_00009183 [Gambusia affinis]
MRWSCSRSRICAPCPACSNATSEICLMAWSAPRCSRNSYSTIRTQEVMFPGW